MKNKRKLFMIGGIVLALILAGVLVIALLPDNSDTPEISETPSMQQTEPSSEATDIMIDDPQNSSESDENEQIIITVDPEGTGLTPEEEQESEEREVQDTKKADTPATPVKEAKPGIGKTEGGSIVIGGNTPEPYQCGTPGHHCDGPETHAYVLNLELEGCPYCGSHSCPSFYATDEWGQTCYTPSKCPSYDIHADPVYYCQKCGKPCGDGRNGTCAEYNIDIDCPYCKAHVKAWTCHSCN